MFEPADDREARQAANPWHALWALLVGFFMILVDATIVAVANPAIMDAPAHRLRRGHLGDQRLPAGLRGAAAGRRPAG